MSTGRIARVAPHEPAVGVTMDATRCCILYTVDIVLALAKRSSNVHRPSRFRAPYRGSRESVCLFLSVAAAKCVRRCVAVFCLLAVWSSVWGLLMSRMLRSACCLLLVVPKLLFLNWWRFTAFSGVAASFAVSPSDSYRQSNIFVVGELRVENDRTERGCRVSSCGRLFLFPPVLLFVSTCSSLELSFLQCTK